MLGPVNYKGNQSLAALSASGLAMASLAFTETRNGRTIRRRWVPWDQLLLKVFAVNVLVCPRCDGRLQRIAVGQQPHVIAAMLDCLRRKEEPP